MSATAFVSGVPLLHSRSTPLLNTSSFRPVVRLSQPRAAAPLQPARRPSQHVAPRMVSPVTVAADLLGLSAVGTGVFLFTKRRSAGKEASKEASKKPSPAAAPAPKAAPAARAAPAGQAASTSAKTAVIGLANASPEPPAPLATDDGPKTAPLIGGSPDESVGIDISQYMNKGVTAGFESEEEKAAREERERLERAERLQEELSWANAVLQDLPNCDGVAILDSAKRIVLAEGPLISDDASQPGMLLLGVSASRQSSITNVDGNTNIPFLTLDVRCVAAVPVGAQGGAVLLASRQAHSFGERDTRVISAVCERLSPFLSVPPAVEA